MVGFIKMVGCQLVQTSVYHCTRRWGKRYFTEEQYDVIHWSHFLTIYLSPIELIERWLMNKLKELIELNQWIEQISAVTNITFQTFDKHLQLQVYHKCKMTRQNLFIYYISPIVFDQYEPGFYFFIMLYIKEKWMILVLMFWAVFVSVFLY